MDPIEDDHERALEIKMPLIKSASFHHSHTTGEMSDHINLLIEKLEDSELVLKDLKVQMEKVDDFYLRKLKQFEAFNQYFFQIMDRININDQTILTGPESDAEILHHKQSTETLGIKVTFSYFDQN